MSARSSAGANFSAERYANSLTEDGRYRLLVQSITDYAICMLDPAGQVTSWNVGAQKLKGYMADEIIGQHFSTFYTAEDRANALPERALQTAVSQGQYESEGWRVRKDGSRFWAYVVIDPIRQPNGELAGFAKVTRDLSERREAEQVLRTSQEQLRLLLQGVVDYAIYMLSPSGLVRTWNAGAQHIKGYRPEEVIGTDFARFYTEEDQAAGLPQKLLEIARLEGRAEKEGWRVRKDGTCFWAHVVIDAVYDEHGALIGFAKITRDITQQRETRRALMQAQKMDAIGQLTGGIAHDFNNLLTAVIGSLELARNELADNSRGMRLLDNALSGARRGTSLTQRLLSFARRQELSVQSIDVRQLIRTISSLLEHSIGPSVDLIIRYSGELPRVSSDPSQLELAILNLAINARDATPQGGSITVSMRHKSVGDQVQGELAAGDYVGICVSDSGAGMDAQTLNRATEPYFTTKQAGKGTGLGLSMVHGLAEQSGGHLELISQPGKGTSATIWLPVSKDQREREERTPAPAQAHGRRTLQVLVVDDDELVLSTTADMLEALGHAPMSARSGAEALAILESAREVDLLLTDYAMPGMMGSELARTVRQRRPTLPVVIVSGYAGSDPALEDFPRLRKPFSLDGLAATIDTMIGKVRSP